MVATLVSVAGCQAARMDVPSSLSQVEPMTVEGRQGLKLKERVRFGEYETTEVDRSWTSGSGMRLGRASREARRQEYTFTLAAAGAARWTGECEARAATGGVDVAGGQLELSRRGSLDCVLAPVSAPREAWTLRLGDSQGREPLRGVLTNGPDAWTVTGTTKTTAGGLGEQLAGFQIADENGPLGAVEVVNQGAVWIGPRVAAAVRDRFAAAAMALLLWQDLREAIED